MPERRSIYLETFSHKNPIPVACVVDGWLMSGIIYGLDPKTGKPAETLAEQCSLMFAHLRKLLAEAGAATEDVLKLNVLLLDRSDRAALNREWEAMFPDPDNRPVRQTMQADLDNGKLIQCDLVARVRQ